MTSPDASPSRSSRFVEGEPLNENLPTNVDTLSAFLSEHDLHESRRSRQNSQSSTTSTDRSTTSQPATTYLFPSLITADPNSYTPVHSQRPAVTIVHDFDLLRGTGRRAFKERLRSSLEEGRSERQTDTHTQKVAMTAAGDKIVGRLRALTTGQTSSRGGFHFEKKSRYAKVAPYPGT